MTQQSGLTLWELLITLLLITTGITGTVSLQLYLTQQGRLAYQYTHATLATQALSEQLRSTAALDLALWQTTATTVLPAADITICTDSTPDDGTGATSAACDQQGIVQTIKVWWRNRFNLIIEQPELRLSFRNTP
jgi:type IV pilus assembly protein PilV